MSSVTRILALCFLLTTSLPATALAGADDILGTYWNPDRSRKVEITREDGEFSGRVVWESESATGALGQTILRGFRYDGEEGWIDGEVIGPEDGAVYRGRLWLEDGDLMMRGFVGISLFGRTATMERVR